MKTAGQLTNEFSALFGNRVGTNVKLELRILKWLHNVLKEARIDENERLIKIIKECGTWSQTSMGFTVNDFESRIKELRND